MENGGGEVDFSFFRFFFFFFLFTSMERWSLSVGWPICTCNILEAEDFLFFCFHRHTHAHRERERETQTRYKSERVKTAAVSSRQQTSAEVASVLLVEPTSVVLDQPKYLRNNYIYT